MVRARHMPDVDSLIHNGHIFEQAGNLERALSAYRNAASIAVDNSSRATALRRQSTVHRERCEWPEALDAVRESANIAKSAGIQEFLASALNTEASILTTMGEFVDATSLYERVLAIAQDSRVQAMALQNLGCMSALTRDFRTGEAYFIRAYNRSRQIGYVEGMLTTTRNYGAAALDQGDFELAEIVSLQAVEAARGANDFSGEMIALKNYAEALIGQGKDLNDAESRVVIALGFFAGSGNAQRRIECLRLLGDLAVMRDDWGAARLAYLQALDLARHLGLRKENQRLAERLDLLSLDNSIEAETPDRN